MSFNANELYLHKVQMSEEFSSAAVSNEGILACHIYSFEEFPDPFDMHPFFGRANFLRSGKTFSLYERLAIDFLLVQKFSTKN